MIHRPCRRRRGPFEDHGVAALSIHPPTYRREPDGAVDLLRTTVSPHSIHTPTYRWEPDGAVDLLRMTAPPHHSMRPPTYWWEPDGAVDLLRMTAYLTLKLLD